VPLISVLMPSYNHEKYIAESIESVLSQTVSDLELIIVDDASTDNSRDVIKRYARDEGRIKPIYHEKNMGIARTLNDAFDSAGGTFLAWTASDDLWLPKKLEIQLPVLKRDDNLVVWGDAYIIDSQGVCTGEKASKKYLSRYKKKSGNIFLSLFNGNYVIGQTRLIKRSNTTGIRFDESYKYVNDYKFEIEIASRYQYYFIDAVLAKYRIHDSNSIYSDTNGWVNDWMRFTDELLSTYAAELPSSAKAHILLMKSLAFQKLCNNEREKKYTLAAIKTDPFCLEAWADLILPGTEKMGGFNQLLKRFYRWVNS
jgi:glycosyltransferase involved in cell wall biosynthesis